MVEKVNGYIKQGVWFEGGDIAVFNIVDFGATFAGQYDADGYVVAGSRLEQIIDVIADYGIILAMEVSNFYAGAGAPDGICFILAHGTGTVLYDNDGTLLDEIENKLAAIDSNVLHDAFNYAGRAGIRGKTRATP